MSLLGTLPKGMFAFDANGPNGFSHSKSERSNIGENSVPREMEARRSSI